MLNEGDTVHIADIGEIASDRSNPGNGLVCNTANVNMRCCRGSDSSSRQPIGNWYFSNGSRVPYLRDISSPMNTLYTVVYTHQVRLVREGSPNVPLGNYTCRVPTDNNMEASGIITITNGKAYSMTVYISNINKTLPQMSLFFFID